MNDYRPFDLCFFAMPPWDCFFVADETGNMPWHLHCEYQNAIGNYDCGMRFYHNVSELEEHMANFHGHSSSEPIEDEPLPSIEGNDGNGYQQQEQYDGSSETGLQESEPSMMEENDQEPGKDDWFSENKHYRLESSAEIEQVNAEGQRFKQESEEAEDDSKPNQPASPEQPRNEFPCSQCPKNFNLQSWLIYHEYVDHNGLEKPLLACRGCSLRVKERKTLSDHKRKVGHEIDRIHCPYPDCPMGDNGLNLKNLRIHYVKNHCPKGYGE